MSRRFVNEISITSEDLSQLYNEIPLNNGEAASDFFSRFGFGHLYHSGRFHETLEKGRQILHQCAQFNLDRYTRIHKGYPFYWMGMAAYRIYDYPTAIYYIDAALSEDIKNFPNNESTPTHLFLRLEGEDNRQAAQDLVKHSQEQVKYYIHLYNKLICVTNSSFRAISIETIRNKLLRKATSSVKPDYRSLATMFISFIIEFDIKIFQLNLRREFGTNEPFFLHLFKGGLLFESLLRKNTIKNVKASSLNKLLIELDKELGFPGNLNIMGRKNLSDVLSKLESSHDTVESAIKITSMLRNTLGHDIGWSEQLSPAQYLGGFYSIVISCFHAISMLF